MADAWTWMSLEELIHAYRQRALSPVEVVEGQLDRIEQVNPRVNAVYHVDREAALAAAALSDRRWRDGAPAGPLDGVPMTIKDALATKGLPGYRGSAAEPERVADHDHPTVARVREAGAVILGKNAMCDYGILASSVSSRHGTTCNPRNLSRTAGASSSGAAASVAAGIEPVAIGTDIVGSIRVPASWCGLAGLKPSQGRVPYWFQPSPALVAGPLARHVRDAALLLNVLAQPDGRDFTALPPSGEDYHADLEAFEPSGLRIVVVPDLGTGPAPDRAVLHALDRVEALLAGAGAEVERLSPPFEAADLDPVERHYLVRCLAELSKRPEEEARLSPAIWDWTRAGEAMSAVELYDGLNAMQRLRERAVRLVDGAEFLILPSTPVTAFAAGTLAPDGVRPFSLWGNTCLFNLTEQPAASLPFGTDPDGLPVGIQIVGHRFDDAGVLRLARYLERHAPPLAPPDLD
ncbi:amidase family protein [Marinibaculum pumilum]|uniref:Amidase family protein n=1 Tax=Marinibaculum pumilum TaxID=1766165 RepID=A0ABV7L5X1_9PROT